MTSRRLLVAALAIVAIGFAVQSQPSPARVADTSVARDERTPAPAPVMSVLRRACFDCHSNETRWPWYAQLPLASHLIASDVEAGRAQLNWSHWSEYNRFDRAGMLDKVCELASMQKMPPWRYRVLHRDSTLSPTDVGHLCGWTRTEATRLTQGGS